MFYNCLSIRLVATTYSIMKIANIIFYYFILGNSIIGYIIIAFVALTMFIHRSVIEKDKINFLLVANNFIGMFVVYPIFIDTAITSIYGLYHPEVSFDGWLCKFKFYCLYSIGFIYHASFSLQAMHRLCRIVYPARAYLQSFRLYLCLSISLWFLGPGLLSASYLSGGLEYLPDDYHCQFAPTNLGSSLIGLSLLFVLPFICTMSCYFYSMYHVRTRTIALTNINQGKNIRRDMIVFTRLVILLTCLMAVAFPHVMIPIVYAITGYLPSWAASFEWALTVTSINCGFIIQMIIFPHLRKICFHKRNIRPETQLNGTVFVRTTQNT